MQKNEKLASITEVPMPPSSDQFRDLMDQVFMEHYGNVALQPASHEEKYAWNMPTLSRIDKCRLWMQNAKEIAGYANRNELNWAESSLNHHERIRSMGEQPEWIIDIGTGEDGSIPKGLRQIYGTQVLGIELDEQKVKGANKSIEASKSEADRQQIKILQGNATNLLPQMAEVMGEERKLINMQLVAVHLPDPILKDLITACTDSLSQGEVFALSDLIIKPEDGKLENAPWKILEADGVNTNDIDMANAFLHGDENGYPGVLVAAWKPRGAHAWSSVEEIIGVIEAHSGGKLELVDGSLWQMPAAGKNDIFSSVMESMGPTIAMQLQSALGEKVEYKKMLEKTWELAEKYSRVIQDGARVTVPPMAQLTFRKK